MSTIEIISILLGISSVWLSWYFGTQKKRLKNKISKYEDKLSKLSSYASTTGYKAIIHDSFTMISYALGAVFLWFGFKEFLLMFVSNTKAILFISSFSSGVLMGAGMVLLELFISLSMAYEPKESIKSLKEKVEKLQSAIDE